MGLTTLWHVPGDWDRASGVHREGVVASMDIQPGKYELTVEQRQLLPQPLSPDDKAAKALAAGQEAQMERLDGVAKVLVTATTITFALLTGLGLTSDRFPALLNSGGAKGWVLSGVGFALAAAVLGFFALAAKPDQVDVEKRLVVCGIVALFASLGAVLYASSLAFTEDGRPSLGELSVSTKADEASANVSFSILSDGVSRDSCMRVTAFWVGELPSNPGEDRLLYISTLRPDTKGVVNQKVTMTLTKPASDRMMRVQVTRGSKEGTGCLPARLVTTQPSDSPSPSASNSQVPGSLIPSASNSQLPESPSLPPVVYVFPGAACLDQTDQQTAPVCTDVLIPAAKSTPIPTPTPTPAA